MREDERALGRTAEPGSFCSESTIRVRYAETDRMGVAWHGEYFAWFEVGRTDWLRSGARLGGGDGRSYRQLEELGFLLPVIEVSSKYHCPARYDDEVVIRTTLSAATRVRVAFDYEVVRPEDGRLLASGRSMHAVTDPDGRPRRLTHELLTWITGPADRSRPDADDGATGPNERT